MPSPCDCKGFRLEAFRNISGTSHSSSAQNAVRNGEKIARELNIDQEIIRLKLTNYFNELADVVIGQVRQQVEHGQLQVIDGPDGRITKATRGVDPRILGEAGRGLLRFAEFAGLLERAPEVNSSAITMVNLTAPTDGASFSDRWSTPVEDARCTYRGNR